MGGSLMLYGQHQHRKSRVGSADGPSYVMSCLSVCGSPFRPTKNTPVGRIFVSGRNDKAQAAMK